MPTIPPFMLKQLYVKGSLQNIGGGFRLTMRNHLAPATLIGLGLAVDDSQVDPHALAVLLGETRTLAPTITAATPLAFPLSTPTVLEVTGSPLAPGPHRLAIL